MTTPIESAQTVWLNLASMPVDYPGIYQIGGVEGRLPPRFRWLHPEALAALNQVNANLGYQIPLSDVLRSPLESITARNLKSGVSKPGYSGHNYGLSIDVDIDQVVKQTTYHDLLAAMAEQHWYPINATGSRGAEDWHFNWISHEGPPKTQGLYPYPARTKDLADTISTFYETIMEVDDTELMQARLQVLGLYHGEIDGLLGPHTREACLAFRRTYQLNPSLVLDATGFRRCLSLASCFFVLNAAKRP